MTAPDIQAMLRLLDEAYDHDSWHGPNLRGSISRIKLEEATWRPNDGYHNVWEITLHAAYWKYVVWRRLSGSKKGGFARKGSDWFARPTGDPAESWSDDVRLLDEIHQQLRASVEALNPADLPLAPVDSSVTNEAIIRGAAFHDVYHAGQIQVVRQLFKLRR